MDLIHEAQPSFPIQLLATQLVYLSLSAFCFHVSWLQIKQASSRGTFSSLDLPQSFLPVRSVPENRRGARSLNPFLSAKPCSCAVVLASDPSVVALRVTLRVIISASKASEMHHSAHIIFLNPLRGYIQLHQCTGTSCARLLRCGPGNPKALERGQMSGP